MSWAKRISIGTSWAIVIGLLPLLALAAPPAQSTTAKVDAELVDQLAVAGQANFWIGMAEQADVSAAYGMDWHTRGWYVYQTLVATAQKSQAGIIADLKAQGLAYESFWIDNSIYVRDGNLAAVQELATRSDVARIKVDDVLYLPDPPPDEGASVQGTYDDWGLDAAHAPDVWALGYDGSGIVVANIDTGVQYNHPQLYDTYRGTVDGTNQYNWCDPSNICDGDTPCDNYGHGTHVMGTMSGENDDPPANPNLIGMAPGSTWIACKGCENNSCSAFALTQCAQWIAAPTKVMSGSCGTTGAPNPDKRPNIVNNSWGDVVSDPWYRSYVQSWQAFGILPAFSAGNSNTCGSLGSPGDYPESFSSANYQPGGTINPLYSSRGPSSFGQTPYCKPNIAAPGTGIWSSVPTNLYGYYTGTSMASPHSAGAVALLWQACPALIGQIDLTFRTLQNSAAAPFADLCGDTPGCADAGCNCTYGYGYLDAYAAVLSCIGGVDLGYLDGYVNEAGTGDPIAGAVVTTYSGSTGLQGLEAIADPTGYYTMPLAVGTYTVTASYPGYWPSTIAPVPILSDTVTSRTFSLSRSAPYSVSGYVRDEDTNDPLAAEVEILNEALSPILTDPATGFYTVTLPLGIYTLTVSSPPYQPEQRVVNLDRDQTQDFYLAPCPEVIADLSWTPSVVTTDTVVQFTDRSTGPVIEWLWNTGDGYTYTVQNPSHTYSTTGSFSVTLTVTDDLDCADTALKLLSVHNRYLVYLPIILAGQ